MEPALFVCLSLHHRLPIYDQGEGCAQGFCGFFAQEHAAKEYFKVFQDGTHFIFDGDVQADVLFGDKDFGACN